VKVLAWWEGLVAGVRRLVMLHGRSAAVWVLAIIGCTFVTVIRSGFLVLAVVSLIFIKWGARCRSDSLSWTATGVCVCVCVMCAIVSHRRVSLCSFLRTVYHVVTFVSLIYSQVPCLCGPQAHSSSRLTHHSQHTTGGGAGAAGVLLPVV
jgi:hypothetical protein